MSQSPPLIILAAHGSSDAAGNEAAVQIAANLAKLLPGRRLRMAFIEACAPSVDEVLAEAAAAGEVSISLLPLLLFPSMHALRDLPQSAEHLRRHHPNLRLVQAPCLGLAPELLTLAAARLQEGGYRPGDRLLLLGRGSREAAVRTDFARLAAELQRRHTPSTMSCAFSGLQEPALPETLAALAPAGRPLFILPWLLLPGRLHQLATEQAAASSSGIQARVLPPLGPHPLLEQALLRRLRSLPDEQHQPR